MKCRRCKSTNTQKNGKTKGKQRFLCKDCGRTFMGKPPKFSAKAKEKAIQMYLNNVGIRKIGLFLGCSPATVLYWIRQKHSKLKDSPEISAEADIIELDEIYTYCAKKNTAYSRNRRRVAAFTLGEGVLAAGEIYRKVKAVTPNIRHIFTDANSCYDVAFKRFDVSEPHTMTKSQTHLIESANSSIRDNLARFNRKTKRYTKSLHMLIITLELFFNRNLALFNSF